jgi:site-specific DNA recombinase
MRSRYLRGELQYRGRSVLDDDGNAVRITDEPLVTEQEWALLQEALTARASPRGIKSDGHLLVRIAYCGECDSPMYHQHNGPRDYYRCHGKHGAPGIRAKMLEDGVEDFLLCTYGDYQIERRVGSGKDYRAELARVQEELEEVEQLYLSHNLSGERMASLTAKLEARQQELTVLAQNASGPRWEPTGETVRQRWGRSSLQQRHAMLQSIGLQWYAWREYRIADHEWRWIFMSNWLHIDETHERLSRQLAA